MGNEKTLTAKLKGFSGPFFPARLEQIQKRFGYSPVRINDILFSEVTDQLHHSRMIRHPSTSDVKKAKLSPWSYAIEFSRHGRQYRVFFPMVLTTRERGTYAQRHVALYAKGEEPCDDAEIELIISEFVENFDRTYRRLYSGAIRKAKADMGIA